MLDGAVVVMMVSGWWRRKNDGVMVMIAVHCMVKGDERTERSVCVIVKRDCFISIGVS